MGKNNGKDFTSFIQEAGLIWGPSPEIYGGLAGFYTYGPLGKLLKNKVENSVRRTFNENGFREIEGPTVLPNEVWKASGHLDTFVDRTIKCKKCSAIFRADKLIEENHDVSADTFSDKEVLSFLKKHKIKCPTCKGEFNEKIERQSLMMKTVVGGKEASLRPETATGTYLPFLRYYNYFRKKLPFGVFQIGKAYRNEISPRQSVLRGREFTQAEGQIFIDPKEKNKWEGYGKVKGEKLPFWSEEEQKKGKHSGGLTSIEEALKKKLIKSEVYGWAIWLAYTQFKNFGIPLERIRLRQHHKDEKAFYADDAWDIELNLNNYGWTEVCGIHDRTDYDLVEHSKASGIKLEAQRENGEKFVPHVIEIAFGTDRPTYSLIDLFYEKKEEGDGKTTFKLPYHMSPIDLSIFPLMKKEGLIDLSEEIKNDLQKHFVVDYDSSGSIGKRYLRSATSGIPYAITIDYDSLQDKKVTLRDRDTQEQKRIEISELGNILKSLFNDEKNFLDLN
ncbi:MAG: glycine--tRNA ligase [Nanoarchaeota archaeon]|nr:glycine--tRNA ligase [Nanoarchaeota archaeon]